MAKKLQLNPKKWFKIEKILEDIGYKRIRSSKMRITDDDDPFGIPSEGTMTYRDKDKNIARFRVVRYVYTGGEWGWTSYELFAEDTLPELSKELNQYETEKKAYKLPGRLGDLLGVGVHLG